MRQRLRRRARPAEGRRAQSHGARWANLRLARRWLHRDDDKIPEAVKPQLAKRVAEHPMLAKLVAMREELRLLWTRTNVSAEQLVADLQAWCRKAEESGIAALQEFSLRLRAAQASADARNEGGFADANPVKARRAACAALFIGAAPEPSLQLRFLVEHVLACLRDRTS